MPISLKLPHPQWEVLLPVKPLRKLTRELGSFVKLFTRDKLRLFSFGIGLLIFLFFPSFSYYGVLQLIPQPPLVKASPFPDFQPSLYPQRFTQEPPPAISADSAMVIDLESGVPLYELNPDERLYPASITKLMTALVALDYYSPNDILTVKRLSPVADESDMGLSVGDKLNIRSLLYGLLVPSGNDAAYTIADNFPGGIENFIYAMNQKAKQLHMENTHFANPSGLDEQNHYTTSKDLSYLTAVALKNDQINRIVSTYGITLEDVTGHKSYSLKNVNQFLGYLFGADGVKTGFTDLAGQCLVASVSRSGHRVVSVVLKSQDRFGDSGKLIEWVYQNFQWINPERQFPPAP